MATTISTTVDTYMASDGATTNYGTSGALYVGEMETGLSYRRSLIKFDLTSIAGQTIISAKLRLYNSEDYAAESGTLSVYRVLKAWTEAGCTWNKYDGSSDWGTAGCSNTTTDREADAIGTLAFTATASGDWVEVTLDAAKVQEWNDGTLTNNGILLKMNTEDADCQVFHSSDDTNDPQLVVELASGAFLALL